MEFSKELTENGVFTVVERHHTSPDRPIGSALSLDGAMRLTLDAAGFEMFVPVEGGDDEWTTEVVDSNNPDAVALFRWYDESTCGGRYRSRFEKGEGELTAYFQDEESRFVVHWTEIRA